MYQQIGVATSARKANIKNQDDLLYDKRVKEIFATVLKKIPKEKMIALSMHSDRHFVSQRPTASIS